MKQYVYTKALSRSGFGVEGIFEKSVIDAAPKDPQHGPIVAVDALIIGRGPGWDDNCVLDEQWLKQACELMNNMALTAAKVDWTYPTIEDYEETVGFKVGEAFKIGWAMARTTNQMFGSQRAKEG